MRSKASSTCLQVLLFAFAAVFGGIGFLLWLRLLLWRRRGKEVVGDRIWGDFGQFSGSMSAGCAAGFVAFAAHMQWYTSFCDTLVPGIARRQYYELEAESVRSLIAFSLFYPLQLIGVFFAMNLLLRRVSDHASHR